MATRDGRYGHYGIWTNQWPASGQPSISYGYLLEEYAPQSALQPQKKYSSSTWTTQTPPTPGTI